MKGLTTKFSNSYSGPWIEGEQKVKLGLYRPLLIIGAHLAALLQILAYFSELPISLSLMLFTFLSFSSLYYLFLDWRLAPATIRFDGEYWQFRFSSIATAPKYVQKTFEMIRSLSDRFNWDCGRVDMIFDSGEEVIRAKLMEDRSTAYPKLLCLSFNAFSGSNFSVDLWQDQLPFHSFRRLGVIVRLG